MAVTYNSIHHYLVPCRGGWLLVDPGFAGTLPQLRRELGRRGVDGSALAYVMFTHWHPDHAGLTQEVKRAFGARLVIHERQMPYLDNLLAYYQRKGGYEPIVVSPDDVVVAARSAPATLGAIGVAGAIVETPGHSEDGVSLVLDGGSALVGDLRPPDEVDSAQVEAARASWATLRRLGAHTAYPAHGVAIPVADVARLP